MKHKVIATLLALVAVGKAQTASTTGTLALDQAIKEAVSNNLDLMAERLSISVAEAREITARLRPNPVLTVSGQTLNVLGANYFPNTATRPEPAKYPHRFSF